MERSNGAISRTLFDDTLLKFRVPVAQPNEAGDTEDGE
jgi:hypothetical protein